MATDRSNPKNIYRSDSCAIFSCSRARVAKSKYCTIHQRFSARLQDYPKSFLIFILSRIQKLYGTISGIWIKLKNERRLYRKLANIPTSNSNEPSRYAIGTYATLRVHLNRLRSDIHNPEMKLVFDELELQFMNYAESIDSMVQQTLSDRQLHTKSISGGNAVTWLVVSALPCNRSKSAAFFAKRYPPGYGGYINFWLNSQLAQQAQDIGHSVFAHVLIYSDGSVSLGLIPIDSNNLESCPKWIFPEDSLTKEDRKILGK